MTTTINLQDLANKANGKKATMKQTEAAPEQKALILVSETGTNNNDDNTEPTPEDVAEAIKNLPGIKIELCGRWLWVSGNTKENKDALKASGLRWASKKKMWYYRQTEYAVHGRSHKSMTYIRMKYGSEELKEA